MNQQAKWVAMGIIGFGGILVVAVLCFVGMAALYQSDSVAGAAATPTVAPGDIPPPRPTTTVASESPDPAATPDPREADYGLFFLSLAETIQAGFTKFSEQNALLSDEPSLLLDEAWVLETFAATTIIEAEAQRTIEYPSEAIPPRFAETHRLLVEAMVLYREAMQRYRQGVDARNVNNMTVNTLTEVEALMEDATRLVNEATAAMPTN